MIPYDCTFEYQGYSLTVYYVIIDDQLFIDEIWLGDNPITELVNDNVYYQAQQACEQDEVDRLTYQKEMTQEMRYD